MKYQIKVLLRKRTQLLKEKKKIPSRQNCHIKSILSHGSSTMCVVLIVGKLQKVNFSQLKKPHIYLCEEEKQKADLCDNENLILFEWTGRNGQLSNICWVMSQICYIIVLNLTVIWSEPLTGQIRNIARPEGLIWRRVDATMCSFKKSLLMDKIIIFYHT